MIKKEHKTQQYIPRVPVPPGATLLEVLEEKGITQAELSKRIDRPLKTINEIVNGKAAITVETALQLEQALGISAKIWNNLEGNYRELNARLRVEKELSSETERAKQYPYGEMAKWNWVESTKNSTEMIKNLLSFFGVTSLRNVVENQLLVGALYRISKKRKYSFPAIAAWLRKGTLDGQEIQTKIFNKEELKRSIEKIRSFTYDNPKVFYPKLIEVLSGCGVALVITPNLKNAPINGASRWLAPHKALIQLSIRNRYNDIFWFSLFHEIGHILLHDKKGFNIDFNGEGIDEEKEKEADCFASDALIAQEDYKRIVNVMKRGNFSYSTLQSFAKSIGIHPAIVIGRLQHDKILPPSFNRLRTKFYLE